MAYVASYLYIAVVWLNHKAAFQHIKAMTRGLHWATSVCCSPLRCCPGPPRSSLKPSRRATPRTTV
ncbi:TMEM175 family protein [Streptomyces sp. NPDC059349]|uniref:TMEM175 family protein n=1 Tax=Streptomyces sp. NPDC059349 TaxID=3346808 RepID=UPI00368A2AF5